MRVLSYAWVICAIAYVEYAGYVFRLHRRSSLNIVSALLLLWVGAYALAVSVSLSATGPTEALVFAKLFIALSVFIGPLSLHFLMVITRSAPTRRKLLVLLALYALPCAYAVLVVVDTHLAARLVRTAWGWHLLPASGQTAWDYLYFAYAGGAMIIGLALVIRRMRDTNDRLERRQLQALAAFTVLALVDSLIASMFGITGSVPRPVEQVALSSHLVSLSSLAVWLAALRLANWRYKLLARLPETFAGNLFASLDALFVLTDRDGVVVFANREAAAAFAGEGTPLEGRFFSDIFPGSDTVQASLARLKEGASARESCVVTAPRNGEEAGRSAGATLAFDLSMIGILGGDESYQGCLVMAQTNTNLEALSRDARLTNREVEILLLLDRGLNTRQVADHLFISPLTAKTHIHNIYSKLGAKSRVGLSRLLRE